MSQPTHEWQVRDQMRAAGIECNVPLIADGKIRRFKVAGSRRANGWVWLVDRDGKLYGAFGDWKTQVRATVGEHDRTMRRIVRERATTFGDAGLKAAAEAKELWAGYVPSGDSEYLTRKGVAPFGIRFSRMGEYIVIPMIRDEEIVGLQKVWNDGTKMFTKGCQKRGAAHWIKGTGRCVVLVEGYATGASIHMATGLDVLVCFDAGNLHEVSRHLRKQPGAERFVYLVAGDNDQATICLRHKKMGRTEQHYYTQPLRNCQCNPGRRTAMLAARELGCGYVLPFGLKHGTDFNDLHKEHGLVAVAEQIDACL